MTKVRLTLAGLSSVFFVWLAFRHVDLQALPALIQSVKGSALLLYCMALMFGQWLRAWRWQVLVRPSAPLPFRHAWAMSNVGLMLMTLLPLRVGELARPILLKRQTGASMSAGIGAVVIERVFDGVLVTGLFFLSAWWMGRSWSLPPTLQHAAVASLSIFFVAGAGAAVLVVAKTRAVGLLHRLVYRLSPAMADLLAAKAGQFVEGLRAIPSFASLVAVVVATLGYWLAHGMGMWVVMKGFGWDLPIAAAFVLVSVLVVGIMIPAGPGFLGPYQSAIAAGLGAFGISANAAAAYGLVVYPLNIAIVVLFALPHLLAGTGDP